MGDHRHFMEMVRAGWQHGKFVCLGLDPDPGKLPRCLGGKGPKQIAQFLNRIVEATCHDVLCYKPNVAFFERLGTQGFEVLFSVIQNIQYVASGVPVILDAKRADIGNTNLGYVEAAFDTLRADAITVHPYLGREALFPFLVRPEKGVIVLCRTSNPGAGEFQDLPQFISDGDMIDELAKIPGLHLIPCSFTYLIPLYQLVAYNVARDWNRNGNCALVVGATYPGEAGQVRAIAPEMPFLIPGFGKQGGDPRVVVPLAQDINGQGMICNSSSGILYAFAKNTDDPEGKLYVEAALAETKRFSAEINQYRWAPEPANPV